jgi:hypothetical protein
MADPDFSGIEARLDWVSQALDTLDEETRLWLAENNPHSITIGFDAKADTHMLRLEPKRAPLDFAVAASNIIHQLRASLDNLVWQLVIANGENPCGGPRGNCFPILFPLHDHRAFRKKTKKALRGVHPDHLAVIEELQPYQHPDPPLPIPIHPLRVLRELSNADKHQELKVAVMREGLLDARPKLDIAGSRIETVECGWKGIHESGAIIGWAKITPSGPHPDMQVTPSGKAGLFLVGFDLDLPAVSLLRTLLAAVRDIGGAFFGQVPFGLPPAPVEIVGMSLSASYMREAGFTPEQTFGLSGNPEDGLMPPP